MAQKKAARHKAATEDYWVGCIFATQNTFTMDEVKKAVGGGLRTVVPRKKALSELEKEYRGYLSPRFRVDRLQVDASTISLLGVTSEKTGWDVILPDSGNAATLAPTRDCLYTYSMCFDALVEIALPKSAFRQRKALGGRLEPSSSALKKAARELSACLGEWCSVDRLEVVPSGSMYFLMLDAGVI